MVRRAGRYPGLGGQAPWPGTSGQAFLSWTVSLWYHNNYHNNYPNTTMTSWHQKPQLLAFSAPLVLSAGLEPSGAVSWSRYGQVPWWGGF